MRLRLVGGRLSGEQLDSLLAVSERFGDGVVHLTARANLQIRGLPGFGCLPAEVVSALESTGLVPSRDHELVRNIMVSPQTGYAGGLADLRPVAAELDRLLVGDPALGVLPGRFLFVLDDGRGDVVATRADLGLVALDAERAQLRVGDDWGPVVPLPAAPAALVALACGFLETRGTGATAAWHVRELPDELRVSMWQTSGLGMTDAGSRGDGCRVSAGPLPYGPVDGGVHVAVPDGVLTRAEAESLLAGPVLIVTPWRGIFVPSKEQS
ncbi:nitrite reductase [Nocardioides baekrokdamisoli]|uniref:nitrite reductase n=1 Tax=Nocardioides baekrokdamisoli TaxID=1804624 RepID=UPI001E3250D0|nr:nitrite reductase [Nocardioides baekrokdamisoli]